ncbi:MAG: hypothetical protein WKF45_04035 [Ilumatobacteraceae bacterium]
MNFDCDLYWTVDRAALLGALSILPEYSARRRRRPVRRSTTATGRSRSAVASGP